jgi:peptide/nickel transport system substrate-binding protein
LPGATTAALAACVGGSAEEEAAAAAVAAKDSVVIALAAEPRDLLGPLASSALDLAVVDAITPPLLDADFDCRLRFRPGLARAWAWSDDGLSLEVALRDDLRWPDRSPVTADDVRLSWNLLSDPVVASPRAAYAGSLVGGAPTAVDASHLRFQWKERVDPSTMVAHAGAVGAVFGKVLGARGVDRAALRDHPLDRAAPLAYGPWSVASLEPGRRLVLEPNESFTGPAAERPRLARVTFEVIPGYGARLQALEAGAVDVLDGVAVPDADRLVDTHAELRVRRRGWRAVDYVAWNNRAALFSDREVRRALAMAIDPDRMIREMLSSPSTGDVFGRPAVGTITPALCGVHNDAIARIPHDPSAARARLAELGWVDSNQDGVIDKDGSAFRFTLLGSSNPRRAQAAVLLVDALAEVGIDVNLETLDNAALVERLRARDFDAVLTTMSAALFLDPSSQWLPGGELNFTGYDNPAVTDLVRSALAEPLAEKSGPMFSEMQALVYEDQPAAFLYWTDEIVAIHSRIQDAGIDIVSPYRDLHRWWVPPDKVKNPR